MLNAPIFNIESKRKSGEGRGAKDQKNEESSWNVFTLIPNKKNGDSEAESYEYWLKALCWIAANDDPKNFKWLYEECSLLQVYEVLMLKKAYNYNARG